MNFFIKLILSAVAVIITSYLLGGVHVDDFFVALIVAALLALLNTIIRPILVLLTIPITIFTLGLFLLVINAVIILIADGIVPGFEVDGFWWALLFSIILSIINALFQGLGQDNSKRNS